MLERGANIQITINVRIITESGMPARPITSTNTNRTKTPKITDKTVNTAPLAPDKILLLKDNTNRCVNAKRKIMAARITSEPSGGSWMHNKARNIKNRAFKIIAVIFRTAIVLFILESFKRVKERLNQIDTVIIT